MKNKIGFAAVLLAAGLCLAAAAGRGKPAPAADGAETGVWTQDYDAARSLAKEKGLPVFVAFTGSDWCGWCKLMEKKVFSSASWKAWASTNAVLVWINFPRDKKLVPAKYVSRNDKLAKAFGVEGFPTYVVLGPDGVTRKGVMGASPDAEPKAFIRDLEKIISSAPPSGPRP